MLLLIAVQYSTHNRDIDSLTTRIEALQAASAITSPPQAHPAPASGDSSPLADQLAQHGNLIRTLEQRLATQIVELDSLRTATSDNFTLLGAAPLHGTGSLDELHESLSSLKTQLAALKDQQQKHSAQLDAGVDTTSAQAAHTTHTTSDLDAVRAQIAVLEQRFDQLASRIDSATADFDRQLAPQLAAIESLQADSRRLAAALANTTHEIDNLRDHGQAVAAAPQAPADDRLGGVNARLDSLSARQDRQESAHENTLARLENQEVTLNNWRTELEERLAANDRQTTSEASAKPAEIARIRETLALLKKQHPFVKFPAD